jgi:CRISPR-associated endonuclease/helicase Cas3
VAGDLPPVPALNPARQWKRGDDKGFAQALLVRMLFSCLVDADSVETERFYAEARSEPMDRGRYCDLATLRDRLPSHLAAKRAKADPTPINALRAEVLDHAIAHAALPPGLFTLTVPTGGGKTLASLSFALEHAVRHGLRRVVYVSPFTSIIEQTAQVFRNALSTEDDILEHHVSFDWDAARTAREADGEEGADGLGKLRRAAENRDVPIVVTTAVQFIDSLFANRTSRCRSCTTFS